MRTSRKLTALLGAALLLACVTAAQAGVLRDYGGRVEKDPNTLIGFNLAKQDGKTRVVKIIAALPYSCEGTTSEGGSALAKAKGSLVVKSDKTFSGKLKTGSFQTRGAMRRGGPSRGDYKITGKLGKHGAAKGTITGELFLEQTMPRGGPEVRCYTGGLDWKASNVN